jgi:hypothetical protein
MVSSLLLHVPLLPLVGLWAPADPRAVRERNVTTLFEALAEEERITPVDLDALGGDTSTVAAVDEGPAPGIAPLAQNVRARGATSLGVPSARQARTTSGPAAWPDASGTEGEPELATRMPTPEKLLARSAGRGTSSGLTREEEQAMRAKWFAWYRDVLGRKIHAAYPQAALVRQGVRGLLWFKLRLSPDGSVRSCTIVRADAPKMKAALTKALDSIGRFPPYAATGLSFFPPFTFRIQHGPRAWRAASTRRRPTGPAATPTL